jgi:hypothetical protein
MKFMLGSISPSASADDSFHGLLLTTAAVVLLPATAGGG